MYLYKMKKLPSQIIEELGIKLPPAPKPAGVYKPILVVASLYMYQVKGLLILMAH